MSARAALVAAALALAAATVPACGGGGKATRDAGGTDAGTDAGAEARADAGAAVDAADARDARVAQPDVAADAQPDAADAGAGVADARPDAADAAADAPTDAGDATADAAPDARDASAAVDAAAEMPAAMDAGVDATADSGFMNMQHVHIFISNTCVVSTSPTSITVPADQSLYITWHNHSVDYDADVWLSYGGGYLGLPTGATWSDPNALCTGPGPYQAYGDVNIAGGPTSGCPMFRLLVNCQ
jgi:hypothetical protein